MPVHFPTGRSVLTVTGEDAEHFLQNLVTCSVTSLAEGDARACGLLTPQGKILFDFLLMRRDGGFAIDIRSDAKDDFLKRLTLYKLRAKVEISEAEESLAAISWDGDSGEAAGSRFSAKDTRFRTVAVTRHYGEPPAEETGRDAWDRLRIAHGVAESGPDFALGDAFPHDVSFDQTAGVDFRKGCYVGQEVVSRMHHRGTARRRILVARADGELPEPGTQIEAGGKPIGALGTVSGTDGLALARIDRAKDAIDAGTPITANGMTLTLSLPPDVSYRWPETESESGD